ncbi:transglutaminase-like cysteine peptidase [Bradyrhizobium sp.]|uniref:transglutaminase-like cysteine peptidase n=1 Tax=Bradyrhizobium sp. TaxID=376 RepID=UPI0025C0B8B0|nr:transglutaminase-like cysteine peptidase [Bradyrhizobium sp.]
MGNVIQIGALALLLIGASPLAEEPFGVATAPAAQDGALSAVWRDLQAAMRADEQTVAACRTNPACGSPAARRFIAIVDGAKRHEGLTRIGQINRALNLAIPAQRDGMGTWKSPLAALVSPGDCKSYAVTKYAALAAAGIAPDDRRLVIVRDKARPTETHLVVAVRVDRRWLILDSRSLIMTESTGATYQPLQIIDHSGVRNVSPFAAGRQGR